MTACSKDDTSFVTAVRVANKEEGKIDEEGSKQVIVEVKKTRTKHTTKITQTFLLNNNKLIIEYHKVH